MPVYEYVCRNCSQSFEELVRRDTVPKCPRCGASDLERVLSVVAVGRSQEPMPATPCGTCGVPGGPAACPMAQRS